MPLSPDQRGALGARLFELRNGRPQRAVADAITEASGIAVKAQNLSGWETGKVVPERERLVALEDFYGCGRGELLKLAGLNPGGDGPSLEERVSELERRLDEMQSHRATVVPIRKASKGGGWELAAASGKLTKEQRAEIEAMLSEFDET